jgi:hypothetical protein
LSAGTLTVNNPTPVASDFTFGNLNQTAGSVTAVTITPNGGKSNGARTIYYEGTGGTTYAKSTTIPQTAGSYTVTFDVAAVTGWNAANGLSAGTLTVNNPTPVAGDFTFGNLNPTAGSVTAVTITPNGGKSNGTRTIYYEGTGGTTYAKSTNIPQTAGSYTVTFDVAAAAGWNAANGLSAGTLTVTAYSGTTYTITNTAEWNTAIANIRVAPNSSYVLNIADPGTGIGIAGSTADTFGTTTGTLTVALIGNGRLYLTTSQGNMLRVTVQQTLIIDSPNLSLEGMTNNVNGAWQNNNQSVVYINGGALELKNGKITNNTNNQTSTSNCGGVYVTNNGTFTMNGGEITSNSINSGSFVSSSGGVYIASSSTFTMSGGEITNNTNTSSISLSNGGVFLEGSSTFTMNGGEITGNRGNYGGGVSITGSSAFTMNGGEITSNIANTGGGGVYAIGTDCSFTMSGGKIIANEASSGGGVFLNNGSSFYMVTGTIYGSNEAVPALRNNASTSGAALYLNGGTAEYGTYSGTTWNSNGSLSTTNNTIKTVNGVLQP